MNSLRDPGVLKAMLMTTAAAVLGFVLGGVQGALLAAWAAVSASVKLLRDTLAPFE